MKRRASQRAILAIAVAAGVALAFLLGWRFETYMTAAPREPKPQTSASIEPAIVDALSPPTTPSNETVASGLSNVRAALEISRNALATASIEYHGGYVEKGRADVAQAMNDLAAAEHFAGDHPEADKMAAAESPASMDAAARLLADDFRAENGQAFMLAALRAMQQAVGALEVTAGGNIGGTRDKLIADIGTSAADVKAGCAYMVTTTGRGKGGEERGPAPGNAPSRGRRGFPDQQPRDLNAALAGTFFAPATSPAIAVPGAEGLHYVAGPDNAVQLITDAVRALPPMSGLAGGPNTIKVWPALPFWRISRTDIAAGKGLEAADPYYNAVRKDKEYRYLLVNDGKGDAVVDLHETDAGEGRGHAIGIPGEAPRIVAALERMADLPEIKAGSYEVRYLDIGTIAGAGGGYVLWLKARDGGQDLVYPTVTFAGTDGIPGWDAQLYTDDEFLKLAKPLAEQAQRALPVTPGRGQP